ncbi:MAG TPA: winged helix-turn-helix domain-containing protein [Streptosporangiaceae bacterium]|nr:winged helix-turn-helix domain-containing protein [Streptosporangiaceae bacterium]
MSGTLRTLLGARAAAVVGRQAERAVLLSLAECDRPLVAAVHGIAGIGKSALLAAFAEEARSRGAFVVSLDCGGIEPTERGFLAALDRAISKLQPAGGNRPLMTVAEAAATLSGLGERVVLVLDTYEQLRLLDTWLRQVLVPSLHDNTRLALAGREPPVAAWISDFGDLLAIVPLANLAAADADALLRREGLSDADAAHLTRFTHGHPLALRLAVSARGARPDLTVPDAAVATVVTELARVYLSGLDQPTRAVLDAACTLRRPTLSLLDALLPEVAPHDAYDLLRPLPFVEYGPDGLVLHDTVREVVAALLRVNDPPTHRAHRIAAWRQLRRELRTAPPTDLWRYTADLLYLIENPAVREAFFPTGSYQYAVEPARPADEAQILAIASAHQPAAAVAVVRSWWESMPSAFRVARDPGGSPAAFQCLCEATSVPAGLLGADPVAAIWRAHIRANPVPRGQQVLFQRHMLAADGGEAITPAHAALVLDLKRRYLEMRPRLRRIYSQAADPDAALFQLAPLGFARLPDGAAEIGDTTYFAFYNDFGPSSIDGWLTDLAGREMLIDSQDLLDPDRRQLVLHGTRADLTRLEFDVLQYLHEREGRVVSRAALLRDVWGYDWNGGSNVVEVVISALRRKLGDSAGSLRTIRGAGYLFTAPS